jgi:ribosomal protein S18 acetylase RimI-like enzyme
MAELESRLRQRGCLKYYLLVTPENRQAVDFYHRLGWAVMDMMLMGKDIR